jgi:hypothetical protein
MRLATSLVNQDEQYVVVYWRLTGWKQERFSEGQSVIFDQLDLELQVESIYQGVL